MEEPGLHAGLEIRMTLLATRVADLRQKMSGVKGVALIEDAGEIAELERRHKMLEDDLRLLDSEGPGVRQGLKAEMAAVADDLLGWVEEHMQWIDSGYRSDQRPKRCHQS